MWRVVTGSIKREKAQKHYELTLAFAAQVGDRSLALRIEYRIKQLTKRQKERLVTEREAFEALLSSLQTPVLKNN